MILQLSRIAEKLKALMSKGKPQEQASQAQEQDRACLPVEGIVQDGYLVIKVRINDSDLKHLSNGDRVTGQLSPNGLILDKPEVKPEIRDRSGALEVTTKPRIHGFNIRQGSLELQVWKKTGACMLWNVTTYPGSNYRHLARAAKFSVHKVCKLIGSAVRSGKLTMQAVDRVYDLIVESLPSKQDAKALHLWFRRLQTEIRLDKAKV